MFQLNIPKLIPTWFQRIFPLPVIADDEARQLFAYQLYLFISVAFVISLPLSVTFGIVGRWVDVVICAAYLVFSSILLAILKNYSPERTASLMIWGAVLAVTFGTLGSSQGIFNPAIQVFYTLLIVCAFFASQSLISIGVGSGLVCIILFIISRIAPEYFSINPEPYELVMILTWIALSVFYLRSSLNRLQQNSDRVLEQQTQLIAQQEELEQYRDALEELVTQRTIELEQAKWEAEQARVVAESANHAKSYFLANMSHELRTPLNAIIGYSEMLEETVEEVKISDDGEKEVILSDMGRIRRSGYHLLSLINQVLDLSKIEAEKVEIHLAEAALPNIIEKIWHIIVPLANKKGIRLTLNDHTNGRMILYTDQIKLSQILVNLLSNAVKFTENGGVTLTLESVDIGGDDYLSATVADTGIGMAPEVLDRIFQPFWQVETTFVRNYDGTGLGLTISQRLCEALGGRLTVTSEEGVGTTFVMLLPKKSQIVVSDDTSFPDSIQSM